MEHCIECRILQKSAMIEAASVFDTYLPHLIMRGGGLCHRADQKKFFGPGPDLIADDEDGEDGFQKS